MFNNDGWGIFGLIISLFCSYQSGKYNGEQKMIQKYETQDLIQKQQAQIDLLNKKIEELSKR